MCTAELLPKGFDCSGLMQYVYAQLGYSINRVMADQMNNGIAVSRENPLPTGDLVGFCQQSWKRL